MTIDRTLRAFLPLLAFPLVAGGCRSTTPPAERAGPEAVSLLGAPLFAPELSSEDRAKLEADLASAEASLAADADDEDALIWVGRRLGYLGRYRAAIDVFTAGLERHPDSYRLLRHRGHRWITLREFELAAQDLSLAAWRVRDEPDAVEPDGAPNALGIPRGTDKTSIAYHRGLALYLLGDFSGSLAAYDACRALSPNDDMSVAADYWRVLCMRRLGRDDDAAALLATISPRMDVIENHQYHRLLLYFRGALSERELLSGLDGGVASPTILYGYGTWTLVTGEPERARAVYQQIVAGDSWGAFGFIAAEAELARGTL